MFHTATENMKQFSLSLVRLVLYPSYVVFNALASLYYITFLEMQHVDRKYILCRRLLLTPLYASMFLLLLPLLCIFLPLRCLLAYCRRPYVYSENIADDNNKEEENIMKAIAAGESYKFGVCSANLCLMPEMLSRMNHLTDVNGRSRKIGERLMEDQITCGNQTNSKTSNSIHTDNYTHKRHINHKTASDPLTEESIGDITASFPHINVLCVQEAWSTYHNKILIEKIHKCFPYIVHDVGIHSPNVNMFCLSSGHLVASRHPIEAVEFKAYKNFIFHGDIISMGVLMIKLRLLQTATHGKKVAYVFNTHLQSYQREHLIIPKQLDEMLGFSQEFIKRTSQTDEDIAFSVVCGDFNMDNLSPADYVSTRHRFFDQFEDFCRVSPGVEKCWTVGTELRQDRMLDPAVTSPEGLKSALEDVALRQCYVVDGDLKVHSKKSIVNPPVKMDSNGSVRVVPEGGRRRIDYVLYDKDYPVEVKGYHFVTRLASLTDHIPVVMEFTCPNLM